MMEDVLHLVVDILVDSLSKRQVVIDDQTLLLSIKVAYIIFAFLVCSLVKFWIGKIQECGM